MQKIVSPIKFGVLEMVSEGRGRLFRRKDGKYLIYLPVYLAEDRMFPFKGADSIPVKVTFRPGDKRLIVKAWKKEPRETPKPPKG